MRSRNTPATDWVMPATCGALLWLNILEEPMERVVIYHNPG
jgi:hypothetical protein